MEPRELAIWLEASLAPLTKAVSLAASVNSGEMESLDYEEHFADASEVIERALPTFLALLAQLAKTSGEIREQLNDMSK